MLSRYFRRTRREYLITALLATLGILLTGRIGAGKSTILRQIGADLAEQGVKLAIACVKPDEAEVWQQILPDAIRMSQHVWSPYQEDMQSKGGAANFARKTEDLQEVMTRTDSQRGEAFWKTSAIETSDKASRLAFLWKGAEASIVDVYQIIQTAPHDLMAAKSPDLINTPFGQALNAVGNRSPDLARPFTEFFMGRLCTVGEKASQAIKMQAIGGIANLVDGPISPLINGKPTITTKDVLTHHTIWDLDTLTYMQGGLAYQLLLSWSCMEEVLRRTGDFGYFGLVRDEYHQLAHAERDVRAQSVGRSQKFIPIAAYQNQPTLEAALDGGGMEGQTQAKALYGLYVNKWFCNQNCQMSAELQAMTIGQERRMFFSGGTNQQQQQPEWWDVFGAGNAPIFNYSQQWHYRVPPTAFMNLRTGGPENNYLVDAITHSGTDGYGFVTVSQR